MTSGWFSGARGNRDTDLEPARSALNGAAQALIDLDTRQGYVDGAVKAAVALGGYDDLQRAWAPVAEKAFKASAEYLDASAKYSLTDSFGEPNRSLNVEMARRAYIAAHRAMADAAAAVDQFYSRNRERIESGKRAVEAIPGQVDQARRAATAATEAATRWGGERPELLDRRSVGSAIDALSAAMHRLDAAGGPAEQQQAARGVTEAAEALTAALERAPHLEQRASSTLPSLRTRLDSLVTRMHRLPDAQSAMWREFNQASSADLADHNRLAEQELQQARAAYDKAVSADRDGKPELALDLITECREHASKIDDLIEEVTGRLRELRAVKADPSGLEHRVRFEVRDAQRLVVDRGLTGEWGSVLDAQSARVDRAMASLTGPHPDYWALVSEMKLVSEFVADVVDRVRRRARSQGG